MSKIEKLSKKIKVRKIEGFKETRTIVYRLDVKSKKKEILSTLYSIKEAKQFKNINIKFQTDRKFLIKILKENGKVFNYLDKHSRDDKKLVLAALYFTPLIAKGFGPHMIWKKISKRLRNDREIVYQAVKHNRLINLYASDEMLNDRKFILKCAKGNGEILEFLNEKYRDDKEIVLNCIKGNGFMIEHASERLRLDKQIGLAAIKKHGHGFEYINEELKNNRQLVLKLLKKGAWIFEYLSEKMRDDEELALYGCANNGWYIKFASQRIKKNKDIAIIAIKSNTSAYDFLDDALKKDKDILKLKNKLVASYTASQNIPKTGIPVATNF